MKLLDKSAEPSQNVALTVVSSDPVKLSIIATAIDFINEYEKYGIPDYLKLIETVEEYAEKLLDNNDYFKSYKSVKSISHLKKAIILRSLSDKGEITVEECSLHILDFIDDFETI